jgi:hypothetical protein
MPKAKKTALLKNFTSTLKKDINLKKFYGAVRNTVECTVDVTLSASEFNGTFTFESFV